MAASRSREARQIRDGKPGKGEYPGYITTRGGVGTVPWYHGYHGTHPPWVHRTRCSSTGYSCCYTEQPATRAGTGPWAQRAPAAQGRWVEEGRTVPTITVRAVI